MNEKSFGKVCLKAAAALVLLAPAAFPQQQSLEKAAGEMAEAIGKRDAGARVVIAPFPLAPELRAELQKRAKGFQVADEGVEEFYDREKLDAQSQDQSALAWAGRQLKADVIIGGGIEQRHGVFDLRLLAVRTIGKKVLADRKYTLQNTGELAKLLEKPAGTWQPAEDRVIGVHPSQMLASMKIYGRKPGDAKPPACVECQNPGYTTEAVSTNWKGETVVLHAEVDEAGRVTDVTLVHGAPFGLNRAAMQTVQRWRFTPAVKPDGTRAPAQVTIEIAYRGSNWRTR